MSAQCVNEIAAEQTPFRLVGTPRAGVDRGDFAQTMHLSLEKAPGTLSRSLIGGGSGSQRSSSEAQNSVAQNLDKSSSLSCAALQTRGASDPTRVARRQSELTPASLPHDVNSSDEAGINEQETLESSIVQGVPSQLQGRAEPGVRGGDTSDTKKHLIAPAVLTAKPKQDTSFSKEKQKTPSLATDATEPIGPSAAPSLPAGPSLQCPAAIGKISDSGSQATPVAVEQTEQPNPLRVQRNAQAAEISPSSASRGTVANAGIRAMTQPTDQIPIGQVESETGKGAVTPTHTAVGDGESKASGLGSTVAASESSHPIEASTVTLIAGSHSAMIGAETNQRGHRSEAFEHATIPLSGSEEAGTSSATSSFADAPKMLLATGTALEVGVQSGTHGWLRVRAELAEGGSVNASLAATSSLSQSALHGELPGLTAYLQEEKISVNAIVIHPQTLFGTGTSASSAASGDGNPGQRRQDDGRRQQQEGSESIRLESHSDGAFEEGRTWKGQQGLLATAIPSEGRSWLSVRA